MFRAIAIATLAVFGSQAGWAQTSAQASITLIARVPSSVSLSVNSLPVSLSIRAANQFAGDFQFPLQVKWNLNPAEVQGFAVVAYFADPSAALTGSQPGSLAASSLLARLGPGDFRPFLADGKVSLCNVTAANDGRMGQRVQIFELKNGNDGSVPEGDYHGTLYFEVRQY